jgi:hypothetical protein
MALNLNLDPGRRILRQFGFIAAVAFGLLGALVLWKGNLFGFDLGDAVRPVTLTLWALGILSGAFSVVYPEANRPLYVGLAVLTYPIGLAVSFIIMVILFYGLITPVGLLFRVIRRDPLHRKWERDAKSYWVPSQGTREKKDYLRQF